MADLSVMGFLDENTQQETEYNLKDAQARRDISTINSKIPSNASSNNKLATKSDVSAAYIPGGNAELATLPPLTSENLNRVFNMIYDFITNSDFVEGAGKSVKAGNEVGIVNVGTSASPVIKYTVFGGFFDTSSLQPKDLENPIEVAGIERDTVEDALFALSTDKEDTILTASPLVKEYDEVMRQYILRLNQDDTPTDNSNNPVKSSGIKSALDATVDLLKDTTGWTGKNEVDVTKYNHISTNCVASASGDDVMTFTAPTASTSNYAELSYFASQASDVLFDHNEAHKMKIIVTALTSNKAAIGVRNSESRFIKTLKFESAGTYVLDLSDVAEDYYVGVYPRWEYNNAEASITFKLMVYDASLDDTYEPYHGTVEEVKADKSSVVSVLKDTVGWVGLNKLNAKFKNSDTPNIVVTPHYDSKGLLEYVNLNGNNSSGEKILIQFAARLDGDLILPNGNYKFSLGVSNENIKMQVGRNSSGPTSGSFVSLATSSYGDSDLSFTQDQPYGLTVQIFAKANSTFDNFKVYPMICTEEEYDLSPTYEPYHKSVEEYAFPRSEQSVLGAKNLLPYPFDVPEGETIANVTYTSADGVVTLNGTSNASNAVAIKPRMPHNNNEVYIPIGKYKFVINSNLQGLARVQVAKTYNGQGSVFAASTGTEVEFEITNDFLSDYKKSDGSVLVGFQIGFDTGKAFNNTKIYPMLLVAEDTDHTFARYAMTNRQLTDAVTPKKLEETSTSEQAARITVPTSFRIAYVFVSLDSDKTFQCVIVKGISSRAFRFTYKTSSDTGVRGYIWYDSTNSRIEVGSFMVNDVEMKNDTNIKLEVFYI